MTGLLAAVQFVKAQEVIQTFTFDANDATQITTGVITDGPNGHSRPSDDDLCLWRRVNSDYDIVDGFGSYYSSYQDYFQRLGSYYLTTYDNGYMYMNMLYADSFSGRFNTYFQLPDITLPDSVNVVVVKMRQVYRRFNRDSCYIDYYTPTGWKSKQVNDNVGINNFGDKEVEVSLPLEAAEQEVLKLRVRWTSDSATFGAYGYFWAIDDLQVISGPASAWQPGEEYWFDGLYATMPQGWSIPLSWCNSVVNTGSESQTGVSVTISDSTATGVSSFTVAQPDIAPEEITALVVDGRDLYNISVPLSDAQNLCMASGYGNANVQNNSGINTDIPGLHFVRAAISSDDHSYQYHQATVYVVEPDENDLSPWSYDNGILSSNSEGFKIGWVEYGRSYTYGSDKYDDAGYSVGVRLTVPSVIPEDYVLRGVELVADPTSTAVGAKVQAVVYDGCMRSVLYRSPVHTVTIDEVNNLNRGYLMRGQYNTIRIEFDAPFVLEPATSYYVGYQLDDNADFAVASSPYSYFANNDGDWVSYADVEELAPYDQPYQTPSSRAMIMLCDTFLSVATTEMPMIRGLVGPRLELPAYELYVYNDGGGLLSSNDVINYGTRSVDYEETFVYYEGGEARITFHSDYFEGGYVATGITLDGIEIPISVNTTETYSISYRDSIYTLTLLVYEDHMVTVHFVPWNDSLQPQPLPQTDSSTITVYNRIGYLSLWAWWNDDTENAILLGDTSVITISANSGRLFIGNVFNPDIYAVSIYASLDDVEDDLCAGCSFRFDFVYDGLDHVLVFYEPHYYTVGVESNDPMLGTVEGGGSGFHAGSETVILAVPNTGVAFMGWSHGDGQMLLDNPAFITVQSDSVFTAVFAAYGEPLVLHDTIETIVRDTIETIVRDTIETIVRDTIETIVRDTVETIVRDTIETIVRDTIETIVRDTVEAIVHDTVEATIYVYDTLYIYIHDTVVDTIYVGIETADESTSAKLYSCNGQVVVEDAEGAEVMLYDAVGRCMAVRRDEYGTLRFKVPTSGVYLVRVGHSPARRIVVVR